jgi:ketosteroid isomerase-like protein
VDERNRRVALEYVSCINAADSAGVAALTAEEFTFTDTQGRVYVFRGEEEVKRCWAEYFTPYPDYRIHVHKVLSGGNGVAIIGMTSGSHVAPEIEERETILWVAEMRDGLVAEWRIYSSEA